MATVLVVDDHEVNRDLVRTVLGYHGHRVIEAVDGLDGLRVVRDEYPDVVITDVLMPGLDGYELVREMRAGRGTRTIPVIFYTANYLEEEARPIAAACGVHDVVPKSGDLSALLGAVDDALTAGRRARPAAAPPDVEHQHVRLLKAKLLEKVRELEDKQRLHELAAATVAVSGDLSLPATVQRVVGAARSLVSADRAELHIDGGDDDRARTVVDGVEVPGPDRHSVVVEVAVRGTRFGRLQVLRRPGHAEFTAADRALLRALADAAGTAVANARRFEDARRRQAWLSASAGIVSALLAAEPEEALELVVRGARHITGADLAWTEIATDDGLARIDAADGLRADALRGANVPVAEAVLLAAVEASSAPIVLSDASHDVSGAASRIAEALGVGPLVGIPLRVGDRFLGALLICNTPGRPLFSRLDVEMCTAFAANASLVLEFARAAADRQRLRVVEDRERIARDLHDVVIQRLYAAGLALNRFAAGLEPGQAAHVDAAVADLDETIDEIRNTIFSLRNPVGGHRSLRAQVLAVANQSAAALGFAPRVRIVGPLDSAVPDALHGDLLATLREALSNAARHARASTVEVTASVEGGADGTRLVLCVADDGRGLPEHRHESGLANLRHRAVALGGTLCVGPGLDGRGLCLSWSVPLAAAG